MSESPVSPENAAPPPGVGALIAALIAGQGGLHAAMAGVRLAASLQALSEGHSAWALGLPMALFAAAPVLLALPAGRLADRHGYHRPVRLGAALVGAGVALALASTFAGGLAGFVLLCAAATLCGSGTNVGMLAVQRTGGLVARDATERMRIFSWLGVAPSFANVVGPVTAGILIDVAGFGVTYAVLGLLPLASLLAARRVPRLPAPRTAPRPAGQSAWDLLAAPGMKRLLLINWLLSMCWDVHAFAVPILGHERGFSASTIGLVLGSFTLSVTGIRLLIPLFAHRLREATVLRAAMLGTALVFALYPLAPNPWAMACCALALGVALGAVQPMIMSTLHHVTPHERHGEALAVRSMTINAASTVMPLVFGLGGAVVGAAALFWAVGGAVGAGSWLTGRLAVRTAGP